MPAQLARRARPSHLSEADLERFSRDEEDAEVSAVVVAHLMSCEGCRGRLDRVRGGAGHRHETVPLISDAFLAKLEARRQAVQDDEERAQSQLRDFLTHPAPRRLTLLRNSAQFRSEAFCRALLESVREVIFDDPKESLARAEHALELSEGLAGIGVSEPSLADLKARAWMELGNARRVVSDFPGAHQAFAESRRELDAESGEHEHEGLYGELFATLLLAQRRFAEGLRWADRAIRAERRAGNRHREGRCLVVKAQLLYHSGERERALQTIELSLGFLDPHREPNVFLAGLKNVAFILDGLGRHEEALARIQRLRPVFAQSVGRTLQLNFSWIEGRIAGRAGDVRSAEAAMQGAMMGFAEQGNLHDAAQAALELANLYLEAGRGADVERLAAWAHMTFSACRIDPESLAALLVWREAARAHTVTVELLASLGAALSARLRHRPPAGH